MKTYEVIATVTERGKLIIPAPLRKAGTRLRLVVTWEETAGLRSRARPDRAAKARMATHPVRKQTAARAFVMLASASSPAPSDAEVRRWLNERRQEKYG